MIVAAALVALAAAFALRAWFASRAALIEVDGAYWASYAEAFARGDWARGLSPAWPPLYPFRVGMMAQSLAGWGHALPDPARFEWAARLVSALSGAALLVPLWYVARRTLAARHALLVMLLAAVHPRLLQYSAAALSEMFYALSLAAALAFWLARPAAGRAWARGGADALSGFFFGAAYLTRPEGVALALAVWGAGWVPRETRGARLRPLFLVTLAAVCLPYAVFVHQRTGHWSLGEKGAYNFWRAYESDYARHFPPPLALASRVNDSPEVALPRGGPELRALEFAAREPGLVAGRTLSNLARIAFSSAPVAAYWPFALLALAGLAFPAGRRPRELLVTIAATMLLVAPLSADRRFFVPLVPLVLVLAGGGLAAVEARWPRLKASWLAGALAVWCVAYSFGRGVTFESAPEQRAAGEWLAGGMAGRGTDAPVVMARKPWVAYYGHGDRLELPDAPLDSVLALARRRHADLLVVDERSVSESRPALAPLLDPSRAPADLVPIHVETAPRRLVLYLLR